MSLNPLVEYALFNILLTFAILIAIKQVVRFIKYKHILIFTVLFNYRCVVIVLAAFLGYASRLFT